MKVIIGILLLIESGYLFSSDCATGNIDCTNLTAKSTLVIGRYAPVGSGGWRLTNNTNYNLLVPYKYNNPDFQSLLNSGKVNSCGIYSRSWSGWSNWSACSKSCGGGTQSRSRTCDFPSGAVKPCIDAAMCSGNATETQGCNPQACCSDYNLSWGYRWIQYCACPVCPPASGIGPCEHHSEQWGTKTCKSGTSIKSSKCWITKTNVVGSCGNAHKGYKDAWPGDQYFQCSATCKCN